MKTPFELGYRMPAEWEQQSAVWLAWPHNRNDWPGKFDPIPWVYAEIIRNLAQKTHVKLVVRDEDMQAKAASYLARNDVKTGEVSFVHARSNRVWLRDSGAIFVKNKNSTLALDWKFNAWAKYKNHRFDNAMPEVMANSMKMDRVTPKYKGRHVVLEGGSIDVNGAGTLLTTEECLLSEVQCRNPGFTREDYEKIFHDYLGITNTIWLGHGIIGDDTHGHVDDLARFVAPDVVTTVVEKDKYDPNYELLQDNLKRLKSARDQNGRQLTVVELPMPKPVIFEGERLPASYANFLISNGQVLVPTFNDANDRLALNILSEAMPDKTIIGIHCLDFVWGLGTIHCASQQEPA